MPITLDNVTDYSIQVVILFSVLLLKFVIAHFSTSEPMAFFRFYCQQLANKVNRPENPASQQKLAGLMAMMINLPVIAVILWLFEDFVAVDFLWQSLLLFFAVDGLGLSHTANKLVFQLNQQDTYQAKQTLKPIALRDVDKMSALGLNKAFIEVQLSKTLQLTLVPSLLFLMSGGLAALMYRLLLEMHYSWNTKLTKFAAFGATANTVVQIIQWLPARIMTILICLTQPSMLTWRLVSGQFFQLKNNVLLNAWALVNSVRLGGVAMYEGHKLRRISFNDKAIQPQAEHIINATKRLMIIKIIIGLFIIFSAIVNQITR